MAPEPNRKNKLQSLLRGTEAAPRTEVIPPPATPSPAAPYPLSTAVAPHTIELPKEAEALGHQLQAIARSYITARRRTGEALLESARWLNEARNLAVHGEWLLFLRITGTSPDTAEQLLHIHARATEHGQFADAIRRGWLNQTAAALLAKPSTPETVISQVLEAEEPLKVKDVHRALRTAIAPHTPARSSAPPIPAAQIPIKSVFDDEHTIEPLQADERALIGRLTERVARYAQQPERLSGEDWALLEPLTQHIVQLLQRLNRL